MGLQRTPVKWLEGFYEEIIQSKVVALEVVLEAEA